MELRWGILGLGKIAGQFCEDLQLIDGSSIEAVGSRSLEKAKAFGGRFDVEKCYASYAELMDDPDVDIIYIATPHDSHMQHTIAAMKKGKHVLCEKPMGVNRVQVEAMINCARVHKVFLMEALWTRFNPSMQAILRHVSSGEIGEIKNINADFAFLANAPDDSRLFNLELAGGSLLDIGIYPIFLSYLIKGMPESIIASGVLHKTGADRQIGAVLTYKDAISSVMSSFDTHSDMVAKIYGTEGKIFINRRWHQSDGYQIEKDGELKDYSLPRKGRGYTYEIEECMRCISSGMLESDQWSLNDSLNLISILDEIRRQVGIVYPFE